MAAAIPAQPNGDILQSPSQDVVAALSTAPHAFLQPTSALHIATIVAAKRFLDPLASAISATQESRRQELRRKRKRSAVDDEEEQILQLRQVYTDGFDVAQIWEQASRILEAAQHEVSRGLQEVQRLKADNVEGQVGNSAVPEAIDFDEEDQLSDEGLSGEEDEDEQDMDGVLGDEDAEDLEDEDLLDGDLEEEDIEMSDLDEEEHEDELDDEEPKTFVQDPNGLNDGFFSIDDFNRTSQFLEQADFRGDDDGAASDEEEIDWDNNPLAGGNEALATSGKGDDEDEDDGDEEGSEEDGPTFGNADLDVPSDDELELEDDEDMAGNVGLENTNNVMYNDFFEPPPQRPSKTKRMRALPKTQPPKAAAGEDLERDMQRAVDDVRRDLFDEDMSEEEDDDEETGGLTNLSTHEKQRVKLMADIRKLEAAAVAKRDWTLSGEARAVDRPINSLLEEGEMEFERVGKPVPVITNEVTEEIEQLIKRRILEKEFDEIIRRRPGATTSRDVRRGRIELDDTKNEQGLAEIYETEHLRTTDPNFVDKRDERTKKEHAELSRMWREISDKLDLLSNWNYKPKAPEASVTVVTDAPTISMEDARPSAAAGMNGTQSGLAPQEVYAPNKDGQAGKGEVMLKGGSSLAKEEMSREEKLRRRRREKERGKRRGENTRAKDAIADAAPGGKGRKSKQQEKSNILEDLKKGGVKVIGKKGELTNVEGKKEKSGGLVSTASAFKL